MQKRLRSEQVKLDDEHRKAGKHAEEAAQRTGELKRLGMKLTVSRSFLAASR
jgi:hypothetical protein